jgi:hypothetical protein
MPITPTKKTARITIFIDELPDGQMQIGITRAEGMINQREARYVDALRLKLLHDMPAFCAEIENRPMPKVTIVPTPPDSARN